MVAARLICVLRAGAFMAVDSSGSSYWASKFDDIKGPVVFTVDIGAAQRLQSIEIAWEFPAKAFSVSTSIDGKQFIDAFSTDVNILSTTRAPLQITAKVVRISMREVRAIVHICCAFFRRCAR